MLNAAQLALTAAENFCSNYKNKTEQFCIESGEALAKLKTAIGNECTFYNDYDLDSEYVVHFKDPEGNTVCISFQSYTQRLVYVSFKEAFRYANILNSLCFG